MNSALMRLHIYQDGGSSAESARQRLHLRSILPWGCGWFTGSNELAVEMAAETMVAIWKGAVKFEHLSRPTTWTFGIAYRQVITQGARRSTGVEAQREGAGRSFRRAGRQ